MSTVAMRRLRMGSKAKARKRLKGGRGAWLWFTSGVIAITSSFLSQDQRHLDAGTNWCHTEPL
jgi:hypothetical protein